MQYVSREAKGCTDIMIAGGEVSFDSGVYPEQGAIGRIAEEIPNVTTWRNNFSGWIRFTGGWLRTQFGGSTTFRVRALHTVC